MTRPYPGTGRSMTDPAPSLQEPAALVLDVDGTLLDTVYLHVVAWWESFLACGYEVSCFDIHRAIGRGSEDLVETLLGKADDRVVDGHAERWAPLRERCIPFHDVPELIRAAAGRGLQVVYCTSGSEQDSEQFREKLGCDDVVSATVSSGDVEQSKPAPDIVRAALDAVGVAPDRAVMLGDTVYDVRAARAAGVDCIGLMCGGIGELELQEAGAVAVYGNPSELLQELEASPIGRLLRE
jgi:phosphoglycolate phosphatase-like HAD superfamily hydrolase